MLDTNRLREDRPLWDQLTLFGPLQPKFEPVPPLQLELPAYRSRHNAAAILTADVIARAAK